MTKEEIRKKLETRLAAERQAYDSAGQPDLVRLPRIQWLASNFDEGLSLIDE